jgi:hypothetical protein
MLSAGEIEYHSNCRWYSPQYPKAKIHYLVLSKNDIKDIFALSKEHLPLLKWVWPSDGWPPNRNDAISYDLRKFDASKHVYSLTSTLKFPATDTCMMSP